MNGRARADDRAQEAGGLPPKPKAAADWLRISIAEGRLAPGERLPPEPELAARLGISRPTLREAMRALVDEGYLRRLPGAGTYVTQRPLLRNNLERNFGVTYLIESLGMRAGTASRKAGVERADPETLAALELPPGSDVYALHRVRTADGRRIVDSMDYCVPGLVPPGGLDTDGSIYDVLRQAGVHVHHGIAQLRPRTAGAEPGARLGVPAEALVLEIWQVDYTEQDAPVLASRELHLADAFALSVYRRGPGTWER